MGAIKELVNVLNDALNNNEFNSDFYEKVIERLENLTYIVTGDDVMSLVLTIQKVEQNIKNTCNISIIPKELYFTFIDMVCGEFLYAKNQIGALDDTFDIEPALSQISAGDTSVAFDTKTLSKSQKLEMLITHLRDSRKGELISFRKLKW